MRSSSNSDVGFPSAPVLIREDRFVGDGIGWDRMLFDRMECYSEPRNEIAKRKLKRNMNNDTVSQISSSARSATAIKLHWY